MLVRSYIEALLTDKVLADQAWQLWDDDLLDDEQANAYRRDIAARSYKVTQMMRNLSENVARI